MKNRTKACSLVWSSTRASRRRSMLSSEHKSRYRQLWGRRKPRCVRRGHRLPTTVVIAGGPLRTKSWYPRGSSKRCSAASTKPWASGGIGSPATTWWRPALRQDRSPQRHLTLGFVRSRIEGGASGLHHRVTTRPAGEEEMKARQNPRRARRGHGARHNDRRRRARAGMTPQRPSAQEIVAVGAGRAA